MRNSEQCLNSGQKLAKNSDPKVSGFCFIQYSKKGNYVVLFLHNKWLGAGTWFTCGTQVLNRVFKSSYEILRRPTPKTYP